MECEGSDSGSIPRLHVGSDEKFGPGLDVGCVFVKSRVKKMDGEEKKTASKKRLIPIKAGFDSDDDEPIGSLLKLKSKRNPKKVKVGLDGAGDKGKNVEVRVEKLVDKEEDLGGMDDTLASFRKKLRVPKEGGSGLTSERNLDANVAEPSCQSLNGHVRDSGLAAKSITKTEENGQMTDEDGSSGTVGKGLANSSKGKIKPSKLVSDAALDSQRSMDNSLQNQKECLDENSEYSLSAFFRKAQSGLIKKSRSSLRQKQTKGTQASDDGLSPNSDSVSEDSLPVAARSQSTSELVTEILKSELNLHIVPGRHSTDSAGDQNKIGICQKSDDTSSHVTNCIQGNPLPGDPSQELSSARVITDEILRSSDYICGASSEEIPEDSVPISSLQRSQSCLRTCTDKTIRLQNGGITWQTSGIQEEPALDPFHSNHLLDGNSKEFLCLKVMDNCSLLSQKPTLGIQNPKNGLKNCPMEQTSDLVHDVKDMANSRSAPEQVENSHLFYEGMSTGGFDDGVHQQFTGVSTSHMPGDQKICSLFRKEVQEPCFDNNSLIIPCEGASHETIKQISGDILEPSGSPSPNSSAYSEKMGVALKAVNGLEFDKCLKDSQFTQPLSSCSAFCSPKKDVTYSDSDGLNQTLGACIEEPDFASVSSQKEDASGCDSRLSAVTPQGIHTSEFAFGNNDQEKFLRIGDDSNNFSQNLPLNVSVPSMQKCTSRFYRNQPSDDVSEGACIPSHDYLSGDEEGNGASSPTIVPDQNGSFVEDTGSAVPDPECKDNKLSGGQRAARKPKKRRHGDMAYEGDADWEILIHEQDFLESHQVGDGEQPFKRREKFSSSSTLLLEAENGGAAAVSAGLKARAVGPVEKIKFKEVLKRKGGLQEYLECRNQILGLWNKDVSRILPLADCGVSDTPLVDEPLRASLIKDIYAFLDHCGYINIGVASEKEKAEIGAEHNFKILKEKNFGEKSGTPVADSDDGVCFILGPVKSSIASVKERNGFISDDENRAATAEIDGIPVDLQALEFSTLMRPEGFPADDCQENGFIDVKSPNRMANLGQLSSIPSSEVENDGAVPVVPPELPNHSYGVQSASVDCEEGNHCMQCDSEVRKRIIVVGAGPAGLTAARHLQRQGFDVTVLEARSRIGGRVFTDRSSLSVPVDLGASIITGVEADVATERRPDPSSLVCAQLGLELTVLNSDCPLYDTVTCQKVPADMDEALEAEYNSLLDDMVLLVAQKGEHAMRMSLEDGLEYALKRRRLARSGTSHVEGELHKFSDVLKDSTTIDDKVSEDKTSKEEILSPLERRVMDWHFANLEYGCAALLKEVSLPHWNQDDVYGGFGGAHCMIKGGYSTVVESLGEGLCIHLNHVVTDVSYGTMYHLTNHDQFSKVKVSTSNGTVFSGDAVLITVPLGCLKAEAIKFSPALPPWKYLSIQRLGFGVLNKVVLEFPDVFWDDSLDYFGATAEETDLRGRCFMFWNVKKTVGAPVLIALVVGKAAIDGQNMSSSDHVNHALLVLRKLFGKGSVPDPVASVVTDWGRDPYSYGAYSYVAVGASGEDYDILGRPVDKCVFFAGEATCKEHPDTVGGAMMSGLREAVRIIDILSTGSDYMAEVEALEATLRHSDTKRSEVRDIIKRLDALELSNVLYKNSLDGSQILTREDLLQDMFLNAKTTAGRLRLAKELLNLPVDVLKSFAGTKEGLSMLNSWILDSMGKDGTQLLRHCVRLLVLVSTDLLAVRLSGIGKTVKEKVCVHTSRDIRAIASQLVSVWIEIFRKEKASNGGLKLLRQSSTLDSSKTKYNQVSGKPPLRMHNVVPDNKGSSKSSASAGTHLPLSANIKKVNVKPVKLEAQTDSKSQGSLGGHDAKGEEDQHFAMSEEEQAALVAAEAARAAALVAAEAYESSGVRCNSSLQLPKIPSFHKFARREQYAQMDESDIRRKWSGGAIGRQDCLSEIDSRNCRVRDWSVDFSAAGVNLENSKMSVDNCSQRSHSNDMACQLNFREHSGESVAVDNSILTKAWVDSAGSVGIKDYSAIERWQSQAAAADSDVFHRTMHITDEEDSNMSSQPPTRKHDGLANESSASQVTINKELVDNQPRGPERIKQAVVNYVASLLMPLYNARKIDREGYKSIMKKTATKVMEQTTDAEKAMAVFEFLDFKRKNKIRTFVDKLIERHMAMKPGPKS